MSKQTDLINIPDAITVSGSNVGIGTSSPSADLDIKRTAGDNNDILRVGSTDNYYHGFARSNTTGALSIQGNQTNFNNILLAPTSGKVGIGTSNPLDALHIASAVSTDYRGNVFLQDTTTMTSGVGGQLTFGGNYTSSGAITEWSAIQGTKSNASNDYSGQIEFKTRKQGYALETKMTLDSSGHVTTPNQPSFLAHSPAGLGSSTSIMKNFVTVVHNTGGHLNSTSGYFTAPVAGKYFITAGILVGTGTGRLEFHLEKNSGSPYISGNGTGTTYDGPTISGVFDLSTNDTMRVRLGSGTAHSGGNHPNTYFCGYLIG